MLVHVKEQVSRLGVVINVNPVRSRCFIFCLRRAESRTTIGYGRYVARMGGAADVQTNSSGCQ